MNKKPTLTQQVQYLESRIDAQVKLLRARLNELDGDHLHEERKLEQRIFNLEERLKGLPELYSRVHALEQALGPVWTTASGHKVTPKLMSDNHLEAALEHVREREARLKQPLYDYEDQGEVFAMHDFAKVFEKEIARRAEDDHFHKLAGKIAPRVVIAKLSKWLRWLL